MSFNSKPIDLEKNHKNDTKLYTWFLLTELPVISHLRDAYYWVEHKIHRFVRALSYFKLGFQTYDFDAGYIHEMVLFQLKRLEKSLVNGCAIQEDRDMKALRLCIKLLEKTRENYWKFIDLHDEKWGKMKTWFEPVGDGSGNSYWRSSRPKANTDEEKEQERKEFLEAYNTDERMRERDLQLAYKILMKYHRVWWD